MQAEAYFEESPVCPFVSHGRGINAEPVVLNFFLCLVEGEIAYANLVVKIVFDLILIPSSTMITGRKAEWDGIKREVSIDLEGATLEGTLILPRGADGLVLFAHGSGSSRHSPRNRYVAQVLQSQGIATLLIDLLTRREESIDEYSGELRFDIPFLAKRLIGATNWIMSSPDTKDLRLGYFGASTGAGAALMAAAELPDVVSTVVSRGGRPDLAKDALDAVRAPTLLIVKL